MKILLANPRGFCAGVDRAIEIVDRALLKFLLPCGLAGIVLGDGMLATFFDVTRQKDAEQALEAMLEGHRAGRLAALNLMEDARAAQQATEVALKLFHAGGPVPLSLRVPVLEAMGFRVIEERSVDIAFDGGAVPAGSVGTVVSVYEDGAGYAVEFGAVAGEMGVVFAAAGALRRVPS